MFDAESQGIADSILQPGPNRRAIVKDSFAHVADSIAKVQADSLQKHIADSTAKALHLQLKKERLESFQALVKSNPNFSYHKPTIPPIVYTNRRTNNEGLFYFLVALIFYFACIRLFFGKYLDNLMSLFFRVTMRQQQIREQLLQTPLASLLLNILFVISAGTYISLLFRHYEVNPFGNFWLMLIYATGFVTAIYMGKYIVLKVTGWIFNVRGATDTYIFIVFLVNKMIGIFLLPFIVVLAFPYPALVKVFVYLSYTMLVMMYSYRFFSSFRPIRNEIKVNRFHFFLYLCAFEIAPLLLIYKVLLAFVERSH